MPGVAMLADALTSHHPGRRHDAMFESTARLTLRPGELDGFKRQVAEIMQLTREADAKPIRYDWFLSEHGTECEVWEAFPDADALLEHQRYIGQAKAKLFREFVA